MRESEKRPTGLLNSGDKLRKVLLENPDLPLLVFAGDGANNGDYGYMSCTYIHVEVGEFLDCQQDINDERCFTDREEFEDEARDNYCDFDGSEQEFEQFIENLILPYEPYWKKCIILYVNN